MTLCSCSLMLYLCKGTMKYSFDISVIDVCVIDSRALGFSGAGVCIKK